MSVRGLGKGYDETFQPLDRPLGVACLNGMMESKKCDLLVGHVGEAREAEAVGAPGCMWFETLESPAPLRNREVIDLCKRM